MTITPDIEIRVSKDGDMCVITQIINGMRLNQIALHYDDVQDLEKTMRIRHEQFIKQGGYI